MIILKILLWILLAILGIILLLLILPVKAEASYIDGKVKYKVKFSLIPIMDSNGGGLLGWLRKRKKKPKKCKKKKPHKDTSDSHDTIAAASPHKDDDSSNIHADNDTAEVISESQDEPDQMPEISLSNDAAEPQMPEIETAKTEKEKKKKAKKNKENDDDLVVPDDDPEDSPFDEDEDADKGKKSLGEKIELLISIWHCAKHPIKKIFKSFKFQDVYMDYVIADEDAHKCAVSYGRMSAVIFNGLAAMSRIFTVRLKTIDIQPGFGLSKSRWDTAVKFRVSAGSLVIAGIWFLSTFIFRVFIPRKLKKRKAKKLKSAAAQK